MPPGSARGPVELSIDQRQVASLAKLLKSEADGKELRRALIRELKSATSPLVADLKSEALSIPSQGLAHREGAPLRASIAKAIKAQARLSGKDTGVAVRAGATPNVRGFRYAARRLNRPSFRHPVYGRAWVTQVGKPRWFDEQTRARRDPITRDVKAVVAAMSDRLASRARSRT